MERDYTTRKEHHTNICISCKKACGGCSWTAVDPITDKLKFEPVPGWTAKEVSLNIGKNKHGKRSFVSTYWITACPLFEADERRGQCDGRCEVDQNHNGHL